MMPLITHWQTITERRTPCNDKLKFNSKPTAI
jgi:hypothetical protein